MAQFSKKIYILLITVFLLIGLMGCSDENISAKIGMMPEDAQRKMKKTLGRIINEGKGGVLCILL